MEKPIYHRNKPNFRIAYVANDQWQYQEKIGIGGDPHSDPWQGLARPATLETARDQMETRTR